MKNFPTFLRLWEKIKNIYLKIFIKSFVLSVFLAGLLLFTSNTKIFLNSGYGTEEGWFALLVISPLVLLISSFKISIKYPDRKVFVFFLFLFLTIFLAYNILKISIKYRIFI